MADNAKRIEELRKELAANPGSRQFYPLGELLRREGRNAEAAGVLGDGLTHHPRYVAAWVSLGRACLDAGEPGQATHALTRALELDAQNPVAWRLLGEARLAAADRAGALAAMEKSLALAPGDDVLKAAIETLCSETWASSVQPGRVVGPKPAQEASEPRAGAGRPTPLLEAATPEVEGGLPPDAQEGPTHDAGAGRSAPELPARAAPTVSLIPQAPGLADHVPSAETRDAAPSVAGGPTWAEPEPAATGQVGAEPLPHQALGAAEIPALTAGSEPATAAEPVAISAEAAPPAVAQPDAALTSGDALLSVDALTRLVAISAEDLTSLFTGDGAPEIAEAPQPPVSGDSSPPAPAPATAPTPDLGADDRREPVRDAAEHHANGAAGVPVPPVPSEDLFTAPSGEDAPAMLAAVLSANEAANERLLGPPATQPPASLTLARLYVQQHALEEAQRVLELLLEREPANLEAHDMLLMVRGVRAQGAVAPTQSKRVRKIAALQRWLDGLSHFEERRAP